jgi:hypothetical protein
MNVMGNWILLSPGGLAAGLATLSIPLVIHLISRSHGQRVLVGSIRLIRAARRKLVYELRMTQWVLYIIRSLMLLITALILGRLATPGLESIEGDVAYVTPGWIATATLEDREEIERDFESAHVLTPGFPPVAGFESFATGGTYDLWPLLSERLSRVLHPGPVHVFTRGALREFGGSAPPLPQPIRWHAAEAAEKKPVDLPLRVAVIRAAGADERARAVEQALQAIQKHRLPKLQWTVYPPDQPLSPFAQDAVITMVANSAVKPGANPPAGPRWLDLNHTSWQGAWSDAGFPQRLLNALLEEEDFDLLWSDARVSETGLPDAAVTLGHASNLPWRSAQTWLAFALILLWGVERWLCERRANAPG